MDHKRYLYINDIKRRAKKATNFSLAKLIQYIFEGAINAEQVFEAIYAAIQMALM